MSYKTNLFNLVAHSRIEMYMKTVPDSEQVLGEAFASDRELGLSTWRHWRHLARQAGRGQAGAFHGEFRCPAACFKSTHGASRKDHTIRLELLT